MVAEFPCGGDAASSPTPGFERVSILTRQAFPIELMGWGQVGPAIFAVDTNRTCEGLASARMTVASDAEPKYQQLRREFTEGIQPRDEYYASVWVATENVTQPPGAYLALEFLDRQGQRTGIAHGYPGTAPGPGGWRKMDTTGRAPDGTVGLRLCLVLHAPGSAWFAAPEVARINREIPWPDLGDTPREIQVHPADVIQPQFRGPGFHAFHHIFPASQAELDQVTYKRWRELNPGFVRVNHDSHWIADQLDQAALHFQRMQETGVKLLWGTANLFGHSRYMAGAATNPNPEVFAHAAAQVRMIMEATHRLGGENYVLWGGREGYDTLLNTDLKAELEHFGRFLNMVVEHKHKIGFKGTILIEPKPFEPTKHQYDRDVSTVFGFLQKNGLEKEVRVNIEVNHATLANLDQLGNSDPVPATDFEYSPPALHLSWKWADNTRYGGKLENGKLVGTWFEGGGGFPLVFERSK